jgi:Protein of unknown function (DUF4245)
VSEQPGRYERSTSGMIGALIVTLLVILAFVVFRACNRTDLEEKPQHVDYLSQVRFAQRAGESLVYPSSLPSGWYATNVDLAQGEKPELTLSMLTGDGEYVGLIQSPVPVPQLLTTYVDPSPSSGTSATVSGGVVPRWDTWTDAGGDTALVARRDGESLMVFGTAPQEQLEELASSLTTRRVGS